MVRLQLKMTRRTLQALTTYLCVWARCVFPTPASLAAFLSFDSPSDIFVSTFGVILLEALRCFHVCQYAHVEAMTKLYYTVRHPANQLLLMQEEQKVAILRARLEDLGVDVDELLEAIGDREDDPPDA